LSTTESVLVIFDLCDLSAAKRVRPEDFLRTTLMWVS